MDVVQSASVMTSNLIKIKDISYAPILKIKAKQARIKPTRIVSIYNNKQV
jgi:hypothetical protein